MLLYKTMSANYDYVELQQDINKIHLWSQTAIQHIQMQCMLISRKQIYTCPALSLNNQPMDIVKRYKYLGVVTLL